MKLSGRVKFRLSFTCRLILVVEKYFMTVEPVGGAVPYPVFKWQNASAADLADLVAMGVLPADQDESRRRPFLENRA
jgi:hypothetical protein